MQNNVTDQRGASSQAIIEPASVYAALAFAAGCWLLDSLLTAALSEASFGQALIPSGNALALRSAVVVVVAIAAAITSTFLIRELRFRDRYVSGQAEPSNELLDSFSECAFAVNEAGEIIDANQAAAKLFSWPVNMFMPMKLDWLISEYIGDDLAHVNGFADLVSESSTCSGRGSVQVIGKALSGRKFVAELSCMPSQGENRGYIVFVRERSEQS